VVLLLEVEGAIETIRVYDGAHGYNEMHRYTAARTSRRGRLFTAVPLEKEWAPRLRRSKAAIAR
jgi:hypothetical protein